MSERPQLEQKIATWLNEQGYPLEMRVASALHERSFGVIQSEYYKDPESGDLRELDVVGHMQGDFDGTYLRVSLAIECKRSSDKPWVIFTSKKKRMAPPAAVAQRAANESGRQFLMYIAKEPLVHELGIFATSERLAYGMTQAFTSGKDVCYSAISSVSKAVTAEIKVSNEMRKFECAYAARTNTTPPKPFLEILLPVVVVEGSLAEAYLNDEGELAVCEVDAGQLAWRRPMAGMPHTFIDVVSWNGFSRYLDRTKVAIERLFELCSDELALALRLATKDGDK